MSNISRVFSQKLRYWKYLCECILLFRNFSSTFVFLISSGFSFGVRNIFILQFINGTLLVLFETKRPVLPTQCKYSRIFTLIFHHDFIKYILRTVRPEFKLSLNSYLLYNFTLPCVNLNEFYFKFLPLMQNCRLIFLRSNQLQNLFLYIRIPSSVIILFQFHNYSAAYFIYFLAGKTGLLLV